MQLFVIPAQAGIQKAGYANINQRWPPACAGVTFFMSAPSFNNLYAYRSVSFRACGLGCFRYRAAPRRQASATAAGLMLSPPFRG
ncbi:MAG TPA: hypothetical protein DIW20_07420 [Rhodospirillaceae bacterium]|nr:hypothetical protein [Rhodospirillaceae bacterium]